MMTSMSLTMIFSRRIRKKKSFVDAFAAVVLLSCIEHREMIFLPSFCVRCTPQLYCSATERRVKSNIWPIFNLKSNIDLNMQPNGVIRKFDVKWILNQIGVSFSLSSSHIFAFFASIETAFRTFHCDSKSGMCVCMWRQSQHATTSITDGKIATISLWVHTRVFHVDWKAFAHSRTKSNCTRLFHREMINAAQQHSKCNAKSNHCAVDNLRGKKKRIKNGNLSSEKGREEARMYRWRENCGRARTFEM